MWRGLQKYTRHEQLLKLVIDKFKITDLSDNSRTSMKANIIQWSSKILERWEKSSRKLEIFLRKYDDWLDGDDIEFVAVTYVVHPSTSSGISSGRPVKSFGESSNKTKRRKVQHLLESSSYNELTYAAEVCVRSSGKRDAANIIKELCLASPSRATNIKTLRSQKNEMRALSSDEALALYVDGKQTKHFYKLQRKTAMNVGHYLYPSYYSLQKSKRACCPAEEFVKITETSAEVSVQAILDLTVHRLLSVQKDVLKRVVSLDITNFNIFIKWGCDGSSGHSRYKQKFSDATSDDEYFFIFSFVPIKLSPVNDENLIVWQNARTSSTRLCRPIKFLFAKETDELTRRETQLIKDQIVHLRPTKLIIGDSEISVHHQMLLTMIDGKICNSLTEHRSTQSCYICGATPKEMNVLSVGDKENKREHYSFGLSTLHCWIRCFECFLHISYRLDVKKWQIKDASDKTSVKQRKLHIHNRFKEDMGLIVDRPKSGFGSTNDGNTARRFFANAEKSADITGLDKNIISRFGIILQALSSGHEINIDEFEKYIRETKEMYLRLYPWYYMPVTVHKLLMHSVAIINSIVLPIGQLSEEAQEARNKDCRRFRESHTRKISRITTNRDLLTMLLVTSDPIINSFRTLPKKSLGTMSSDVLNLLKCPSIPSQTHTNNPSTFEDADEYIIEDSTEFDSDSDDSDYTN